MKQGVAPVTQRSPGSQTWPGAAASSPLCMGRRSRRGDDDDKASKHDVSIVTWHGQHTQASDVRALTTVTQPRPIFQHTRTIWV